MSEGQQHPYLNYNQTPVRKVELFSTPELEAEVRQALEQESQEVRLTEAQNDVVNNFTVQLENITYPADIEGIGNRIMAIRKQKASSN
jgi:hypothetical protein